jgi:tRNA 2-thiouridine synthesizing protein D
MKFSIVVYAAPYSSEAAASAYNFCKAALAQGHDIYRLFFFGDGVHNASSLAVAPQDENNLQQLWHALIQQHDLDSVICVSSALKRGIVDTQEAGRHDLLGASAYDSSEISGLGQLVDATANSDRVVNFG